MDEQNNENSLYQIIYIFEIQENLDKLEGHGAYQAVGYVIDEQLAREMAHINPNNPGKVIKRPAIFLPDGKYYLLLDTSPVRIDSSIEDAQKAVALAKLTPKEKEMLGLPS